MDQVLLVNIHAEGFADVRVPDLVTVAVRKSDMFLLRRPCDVPSSLRHAGYKCFTARAVLKRFHDGDCTVGDKTFLCLVDQQMVLVLAPSADHTFLDLSSIEVLSLFCNRKTTFHAELVGEDFLLFQISSGLVQLPSVNVRDGIRDDVDVKGVAVLMDRNQALVSGEKLVAESSPDLHALFRSHLLVPVKADDVVCVHPSGVFLPDFLLLKECLVNIIVSNPVRFIRTDDVRIPFNDFLLLKHVLDHVLHCSM